MAKIAIFVLMYVDIWIALGVYAYFSRIKNQIGFQQGIIISIVMGGDFRFSNRGNTNPANSISIYFSEHILGISRVNNWGVIWIII